MLNSLWNLDVDGVAGPETKARFAQYADLLWQSCL